MIIEQLQLKNGTALALKFDMVNAPLLVIRAPKGFVMCGYLDVPMANRLGDVAAKVRGVKTFDDILNAAAVEVTEAAAGLGIRAGMSGREALERMF
ncbi:MAG TPA: DUF1805 domain-containing protein [Candidatus Methanoperedenaceae archaeon]|nr:DUF1805 domain-containing protein [Candidatus Methanoperedenaceae archaeon]